MRRRGSVEGADNAEALSPTTQKIFRQPYEAQCAAEGKSFSAMSAEQFGAGVSGSQFPSREFKGLRKDSQRASGKPFSPHVGWGGSMFSADLAFTEQPVSLFQQFGSTQLQAGAGLSFVVSHGWPVCSQDCQPWLGP